jgi:hypothetical protein
MPSASLRGFCFCFTMRPIPKLFFMISPELIARVINLIQKNGDKVVLADPTTGKAVVVLDLDVYEKLCGTASSDVSEKAAPVVSMPVPKPAFQEFEKRPEVSQIVPKKKLVKVGPEMMGATHVMADLTQEQLIDKINRDIGTWKNAQLIRRDDEIKPGRQEMPRFEAVAALEDEERFYLEPIE